MIHWARWFSGLGLFVACLLLWEVVHFRRRALAKLDRLHAAATPIISISDTQINKLHDGIEGVRNHMASNHDEVDGELRQLTSNSNWLVHVFKRYLTFEKKPPDGPDKVRK